MQFALVGTRSWDFLVPILFSGNCKRNILPKTRSYILPLNRDLEKARRDIWVEHAKTQITRIRDYYTSSCNSCRDWEWSNERTGSLERNSLKERKDFKVNIEKIKGVMIICGSKT